MPNNLEKLKCLAARSEPEKLTDLKVTGAAKVPSFYLNEKGIPYNDVRNMVLLVEFILGKNLRFNMFKGNVEIFGPVPWAPDDNRIRGWTDTDTLNLLRLGNEYCLRNRQALDGAIDIVANNNRYNPLTDFLEGLQYRGDGYIDRIAVEYLGCENTEYTRGVMKLFYLGLVQRAYYPGCKNDNVPVLIGDQGSYKSSFSRVLVRNDEWFTDGIDSFGDRKKVGEQVQGKWLGEIPEMSAMRKSDMESVKACISSTCDSYREAYTRRCVDHPRYTVFIGTTNNKTFLKDATGNRRFLPLEVNPHRRTKDLFTSKTRDEDFDGALAEAVHIFKEQTKHGRLIPLVLPKKLLPEAQERQNNANAYEEWRGLIETWLEERVHDQKKGKQFTCAVDIWCNCFGKDKGTFTNKEAYRINQILDDLQAWERVSSVRIIERTKDGYTYFDYRGRGFRYNPATTLEQFIETDPDM